MNKTTDMKRKIKKVRERSKREGKDANKGRKCLRNSLRNGAASLKCEVRHKCHQTKLQKL